MSLSRVTAFAFLAFGSAPIAFAQSSQLALPREFPPASYSSNQYVDSTGCAFLRAGLSGAVTWVPRVNRDRAPLCGFQPSIASASTAIAENAAAIAENAAAIANAPVISIDVPPDMPIATAAAEMADVGMPFETVASLTIPPRVVVPQTVSPRIVAAPAAVAVPTIAPDIPAAIPRMTMAQICADMDATGHRYMNAETGVAVRCGPQLQPVSTGLPVLAQGAAAAMVKLGGQVMTIAELCQLSDATGNRYLNAATGIPVRCGPQVQSPSGLTAPLGQRLVAQAPMSPPILAPVAPAPTAHVAVPNPAAQPTIQPPAVVSPPVGYVPVWDDGRLNPNRGLPEANAQANLAAVTLHVSAMNTPQPVAGSHRFVQVGTFADPANAERTAALLQSMGLPVGFASTARNGTPMRIVAAGPFGDAASLQAALQAARSAGFSDAFTRS